MIEISPLRHRDIAALAAMFNQRHMAYPYRWDVSAQAFRETVLFDDGQPFAEFAPDAEGCLIARSGEYTLGFAHCAIGQLDGESSPQGFVRTLTLSPLASPEACGALLAAAENYFRARHVRSVHLFHLRGGYPCVLAGRGALWGDQLDLMALLGRAGYEIGARWLLYERTIHGYGPERLPALPLTLTIDDAPAGGFALQARLAAKPVAKLVVDALPALCEHTGARVASLRSVNVSDEHKRQGIGRWLLARALNELAARHFSTLLADINHVNAAAQRLLFQAGFAELALTGYTFDKTLHTG